MRLVCATARHNSACAGPAQVSCFNRAAPSTKEVLMADQPIELLKKNIEAFNKGDFETFGSTFAPKGRYEEHATRRVSSSRDEEVDLTRGWRDAFPDARGTIRNIFASGDQAVAEITWEGTHKGNLEGPTGTIPPSGKHVSVPASMVVKVRDGEITESHHYFDMNTLVDQIRS
jgi:steroid delta-isomerase-like uncharacterized protein